MHAPVASVTRHCPHSVVTSISAAFNDGHCPVVGSGVQGRDDDFAARSRSDLTKCGATCGSGCHELAISGSEAGGQPPKLLVVTKPSLKMYVIFALHRSSLVIGASPLRILFEKLIESCSPSPGAWNLTTRHSAVADAHGLELVAPKPGLAASLSSLGWWAIFRLSGLSTGLG